ncbi:hypothetical protein L6164_024273 [Bauhinia variegata]|uniref:Uncharacterized protein n=1 Tax=Bauhinia variegata TaxID=167791 RepID=A0ACB9LXB6_BAUVA|nr:hypothetical protein L6164_024273 [Bauhinia variegata]
MRTSCCLNLPPPPPTSNQATNSSFPVNPPQVSLVKKEGCWRRQCVCVVMGVACCLIGLQMGNFNGVSQSGIAEADAQEMSGRKVAIAKWSEKRACPSWRHNSYETIVPENLPRPKARRRYQAVAVAHSNTLKLQTNPTCFSM